MRKEQRDSSKIIKRQIASGGTALNPQDQEEFIDDRKIND
jgi:hypothetical protein